MKIIFILFLCLGLAGCATVKTVQYEPSSVYAPTNPQDVRVFSVRPPREYIEIGEVSVEAPVYDIMDTIEQLRDKVAEMGGEAVILRVNEEKGIVIRFKD